MAVVLSGALDDGAAGAAAVAMRGGRVVVQHPDEALYSSMPRCAVEAVGTLGEVEQAPVSVIADHVATWARAAAERVDVSPAGEEDGQMDQEMDQEVDLARLDPQAVHDPDRPGRPSGFGCPDCAGSLFEISEGELVRYRCRVGHAWSAESLLARQSAALEGALWVALRSLEEQAALNANLGERADERGHDKTATRFRENVQEATGAAELVRRLITEIGDTTLSGDADRVPGS